LRLTLRDQGLDRLLLITKQTLTLHTIDRLKTTHLSH
jgi:hypothetical protein